jgi:hypothetical protein
MKRGGTVLVVVSIVALGYFYGYLRAAVGVGLFVGIVAFGLRYWRDVGLVPPEPEVTDVGEYGLKYVCTVCGLELRVEVAARDKAPTHCMEPMQLIRSGGKPPLRSV